MLLNWIDMARKRQLLFVVAKLFNVRNIRPITKYSYFNYKENDDVVVKFDFSAGRFLTECDVTFCWMCWMCEAS